jgi:hypothetical protein
MLCISLNFLLGSLNAKFESYVEELLSKWPFEPEVEATGFLME